MSITEQELTDLRQFYAGDPAVQVLVDEVRRLREQIESFPLRIYDAFTCPNCRGSQVQAPGFLAESEDSIPCVFCKGHGCINFADILTSWDDLQRSSATSAARLARIAEIIDKEHFETTFMGEWNWDELAKELNGKQIQLIYRLAKGEPDADSED